MLNNRDIPDPEENPSEFSPKIHQYLKKELILLHDAFEDPFAKPSPWRNDKKNQEKKSSHDLKKGGKKKSAKNK